MKFSEIAGQNRIKNQLLHTVSNNRVSHAQLFTGPPGCGKMSLAIAYAQYINCENKKAFVDGQILGDSCGICASCVKYNKLAHPDLHFFFPTAGNKEVKKPSSKEFINKFREYLIGSDYLAELNQWYEVVGLENKQGIINAEDCNEVIRLLSYKAYEAEYKVVIIWMAEKLFHSAAPKLLKILEEPPEKTLFLMITEHADQMLNTITSRAQAVKIPKLSDKEIVQTLIGKFSCSEVEARKIAVLADGNLKQAITLISETDEENNNFITARNWLRLCYKNDVIGLTHFAEETAKFSREKQKSLLAYVLRTVRYCLLMNFGMSSLVKLEGEEKTFVTQLSPFLNADNGPDISSEINPALFHIERNANTKILFLDLSLKTMMLLKKTKPQKP